MNGDVDHDAALPRFENAVEVNAPLWRPYLFAASGTMPSTSWWRRPAAVQSLAAPNVCDAVIMKVNGSLLRGVSSAARAPPNGGKARLGVSHWIRLRTFLGTQLTPRVEWSQGVPITAEPQPAETRQLCMNGTTLTRSDSCNPLH